MTKLMDELIKLNQKIDMTMADIKECQMRLLANNDSTVALLRQDLSDRLAQSAAKPKPVGRPRKKI